jgi:hypothetical protein
LRPRRPQLPTRRERERERERSPLLISFSVLFPPPFFTVHCACVLLTFVHRKICRSYEGEEENTAFQSGERRRTKQIRMARSEVPSSSLKSRQQRRHQSSWRQSQGRKKLALAERSIAACSEFSSKSKNCVFLLSAPKISARPA